ncbi:MAG: amidase family protein [Firmicutes bacterium]|nr:amidase family protein [Bacillota bacterium]
MDYYITDYKASGPGAVALESGIMRKNRPAAAGSGILANFAAPFDAAVVTRLLENGVEIAGSTRMSEFGVCIAPDEPVPASGAVRAVADGAAAAALCNDVFGLNRRQAAENGVCYIHPTYGTVSRFGLIPLACSMDQIGAVCRDLADGFRLLSLIAGNDPNDGAMFPEKKYEYKRLDKKIRVGLPAGVVAMADGASRESLRDFAAKFAAADAELPYFGAHRQVMTILACAEISGNLSRYDGVKFGYRSPEYGSLNELYLKSRTEGFGAETKLAVIMGVMTLSREEYVRRYDKAMRIRRLIRDSLRFGEYDVIALPAAIGGSRYDNLALYSLAPLAGLPSVSFPYGGSGIQLVADVKNESALLTAWEVSRT